MDLSFLDKTSGVTPLLVRLYDSHKLHGLAKDKQPLARAELTSAVSELLEMKLSPRESELVADVLIALMRQAELDLRRALAERLSMIDSVPLRVILQIANDTIDIASPVLRNSSVLGDMDLIYIIKSKPAEYWRAIAERKVMSDHVQELLAETRDFETALTLAENDSIKLTEGVVSILSDLAQGHDDLATPLLRRDEISNEVAAKLYKFVGSELKQYIFDKYEIDSSALIEAVDEIVLEFVDAAESDFNEFIPAASMLKSADRFFEKGLLTVNLMLGTLKRGQIQPFVAQFAKFTNLSPATIADILMQPTGQGLAIACKAFGISKQDFTSIFLLTNRVRNHGKMVDLKDLTRAVHYYDQIKSEIARGIMKNSAGEKPAH